MPTDLMQHYQPTMPSRQQIVAQNWMSADCGDDAPAPPTEGHAWMTSGLDEPAMPEPKAPPAAQQPAAATASKAPAAQQQSAPAAPPEARQLSEPARRQPGPGEQFSPFELMAGGRLTGGTARIVHTAMMQGRRGMIF